MSSITLTANGKIVVGVVSGLVMLVLGSCTWKTSHRWIVLDKYPDVKEVFELKELDEFTPETFRSLFISRCNVLAEMKELEKNSSGQLKKELQKRIQHYDSSLKSMKGQTYKCPSHTPGTIKDRTDGCRVCKGSGTTGWLFKSKCNACGGRGVFHQSVTDSRPCPLCGCETSSGRLTGSKLLGYN